MAGEPSGKLSLQAYEEAIERYLYSVDRASKAVDLYHRAKDFGSSESILKTLRTEVESAIQELELARSVVQ